MHMDDFDFMIALKEMDYLHLLEQNRKEYYQKGFQDGLNHEKRAKELRMRCDNCKFAPPADADGFEDECGYFEKYGKTFKDGSYGCTLHYKTLEKFSKRHDEDISWQGLIMGLEMDFATNGFNMDKTISDCKHMIGLDRASKIYHRNGHAYYKAYRNGWGTGKQEKPDFEVMCHKVFGLMNKRVSEQGNVFYHLTDLGIEWLSMQLGVVIREAD